MITFNQPLWWKALTIIESEPHDSDLRKIVFRLRGFHTLMSFLGCIGHIMAGSGLQSVLEQVYASNTVTHILTGKAYERAVRGHLVASALNTVLAATCFGIPLPSSASTSEQPAGNQDKDASGGGEQNELDDNVLEDDEGSLIGQPQQMHRSSSSSKRKAIDQDLKEITKLYDDLMSLNKPVEDVMASDSLCRMSTRVQTHKESLNTFPTARLWVQYLDMIDIVCRFLRSERIGNWKLHMRR